MATAEITKEDVKVPDNSVRKKLAFVLHNVLTSQECKDYIKQTEKRGYDAALVGSAQMLRTDVRNSARCIWDSEEEANKIWQRIKKYVPEVYSGHKALGLNERLRFLRYDPGEYFKPHMDGTYRRENGERSYITVQVYLNEGFEGGSTTFLSWEEDKRVEVVPKTGSVLIFQHDIYHEGSKVIKGRKYAVRTDVMFSKEQVVPI